MLFLSYPIAERLESHLDKMCSFDHKSLNMTCYVLIKLWFSLQAGFLSRLDSCTFPHLHWPPLTEDAFSSSLLGSSGPMPVWAQRFGGAAWWSGVAAWILVPGFKSQWCLLLL